MISDSFREHSYQIPPRQIPGIFWDISTLDSSVLLRWERERIYRHSSSRYPKLSLSTQNYISSFGSKAKFRHTRHLFFECACKNVVLGRRSHHYNAPTPFQYLNWTNRVYLQKIIFLYQNHFLHFEL